MDLREYLKKNKIKTKEFADLCGYSASMFYGIFQKTKYPSKRLAKIIELNTNGQVKAETLLKEYKEVY